MLRLRAAVMSAICLLACETAARAEDAAAPHVYAENKALVHIHANKEVVLQQSVDGAAWRDVCVSPCDASLPTSARYRIVGPGTMDSRAFSLDERDGQVVLDVERASSAVLAGGITLLVVGPLLMLAGFYVTMVGQTKVSDESWCVKFRSSSCNGATAFIAGGLTTLGAGIAIGIVGGILVVLNSSTKVGQLPPPDIGRRPEWNVERVAAPATPWVFPIVAVTF